MPDPIVMVQAFAELRYDVVVHMRENSVKYGHNFNHKNPCLWLTQVSAVTGRGPQHSAHGGQEVRTPQVSLSAFQYRGTTVGCAYLWLELRRLPPILGLF